MFNRFMKAMLSHVLFLGVLFGILYFLLIAASPDPLIASAKYYFWLIAPLAVFGTLFGAIGTIRDMARDRNARR